jgi:hypothetical protein
MKEIKDIHLKADAVLSLFEQIINTVSYDHFYEFREDIVKKSTNEEEFIQLNEHLCSTLLESCVVFLYEDVLSKPKFKDVQDQIFDYLEEELGPELSSERALRIEMLYVKHYNAMFNFSKIMIDNLADKITIKLK